MSVRRLAFAAALVALAGPAAGPVAAQPLNRLREVFPAPSFDYDGRATLTAEGFDLLTRLLALNPAQRITAQDALAHKWCAHADDYLVLRD